MTSEVGGQHKARVLVVEDDPAAADHYALALRFEGYEVGVAHDGPSAVSSAVGESGRFDAILLDLRIPLMDGLAVLRHLRTAACCRDTPVAIITGNYALEEETLAELGRLGAIVRYKPVWVDDIAEIAKALLSRRAPGT